MTFPGKNRYSWRPTRLTAAAVAAALALTGAAALTAGAGAASAAGTSSAARAAALASATSAAPATAAPYSCAPNGPAGNQTIYGTFGDASVIGWTGNSEGVPACLGGSFFVTSAGRAEQRQHRCGHRHDLWLRRL